MNKTATKIHTLKERIYSKYDYLQPKKIIYYDLSSMAFKHYVDQYNYFLYHRLKCLKKTEGKIAVLAMEIRKDELEKQVQDFKKNNADLYQKKAIFLNAIVKSIDKFLKENKK